MTNQVGERRLPQLEPRRDGHADAFHTFVRKWVVTLKSVLHSGKTATAEFCRNVYTNHKFVRSVAFTLFYVHTLLDHFVPPLNCFSSECLFGSLFC